MMIFTDHARTRPDVLYSPAPPQRIITLTRNGENKVLREPSPIRSTVCRYTARRGWKFSHAEIRTSQALSIVKKIGGKGWKFSLCKSVDVVGYLRSGNFSGIVEVPSTEI